MKRFQIVGLLVLFLMVAAPASASLESAVNGVNGIATAIFDPIAGAIEGEAPGTENFPNFGVLDPAVKLITGTVYGGFFGIVRVMSGVMDIVTSPFPVDPISPPARVNVFAVVGYETAEAAK